MINKNQLESLKVGQELNCYNEEGKFLYNLTITSAKWGRNGIRYKSDCYINSEKVNLTGEIKSYITPKFTINGSFNNSGLHNPSGKSKRFYTLKV